jgi:hypothetical protein
MGWSVDCADLDCCAHYFIYILEAERRFKNQISSYPNFSPVRHNPTGGHP